MSLNEGLSSDNYKNVTLQFSSRIIIDSNNKQKFSKALFHQKVQ